jgi:hypothetical protein
MTDEKVIHIYDWRPPWKPGEPYCAIPVKVTPTQHEKNERSRMMRPSEVALVIASVALISLLIVHYV